MMWLLLFMLHWPSEPSGWSDLSVKEIVYLSEVYGDREIAVAHLFHRLHKDRQNADLLIKALGTIKHEMSEHRIYDNEALAFKKLELTHGVLVFQNSAYLLTDGQWLEPGDWVGDHFFRTVVHKIAIFERSDGLEKEIPLLLDCPQDQAVFRNTQISDILVLAATEAGFNSFLPSRIKQTISGNFKMNDWFSFMDEICALSKITWTRRGNNIIFSAETFDTQVGHIKSIKQRNQPLGAFLQELAKSFQMELVMDDVLSEIQVDIHLQEQPWSEVLDCLSLMNDFTWDLDHSVRDRPRLFIQKVFDPE